MTYEYSRDTVWTTHEGKKVRVRHMEDTHLVNLMYFLAHYQNHPAHDLLKVLATEVLIRELPDSFVINGPYPYPDQNGNMIIWDYTLGRPVPYRGMA